MPKFTVTYATGTCAKSCPITQALTKLGWGEVNVDIIKREKVGVIRGNMPKHGVVTVKSDKLYDHILDADMGKLSGSYAYTVSDESVTFRKTTTE